MDDGDTNAAVADVKRQMGARKHLYLTEVQFRWVSR